MQGKIYSGDGSMVGPAFLLCLFWVGFCVGHRHRASLYVGFEADCFWGDLGLGQENPHTGLSLFSLDQSSFLGQVVF